MQKKPGTENQALQFLLDNKDVFDLISRQKPTSGFESAVRRLLGVSPAGKTTRVGGSDFIVSRVEHNRVSFLPELWRHEFDKMETIWSGCERWWIGYPLIVWIELQSGSGGAAGFLKLVSEVGPLADHDMRKDIIGAIKASAFANGFERIHFQAGASDKGRLYSRFLRQNSIAINDMRSSEEIEKKFAQLLAGFKPEFEMVASVIQQFVASSKA